VQLRLCNIIHPRFILLVDVLSSRELVRGYVNYVIWYNTCQSNVLGAGALTTPLHLCTTPFEQITMPVTGAAARLGKYLNSAILSSGSRLVDPACGTCRKKSRKCDRGRPHCARCVSKGLVCEGYPRSFKIYDIRSESSRHEIANSKAVQKRASLDAVLPTTLWSDLEQTQLLLTHCQSEQISACTDLGLTW
jgi:hypothetical protein